MTRNRILFADPDIPSLRSRCGALDRFCTTPTLVKVSARDSTVHAPRPCVLIDAHGGGVINRVPLVELFDADICHRCGYDLTARIQHLRRTVSLFARLSVDPAEAAAAVGSEVSAAADIAAAHGNDVVKLEEIVAEAPDGHDELLRFGEELLAVWAEWFATVGAAELIGLAALAGPHAVADLDGIALVSTATVEGPVRPGFVDAVFRLYAAAIRHRLADPRQATIDAAAGDDSLFDDVVVNAETAELAALVAQGLDLVGVIDAVRTSRRRDAISGALDVIESQAEPVRDTGRRVVVAAAAECWRRQFWVMALVNCFPARKAGDAIIARLPQVVADIVVRSMRLDHDGHLSMWSCASEDDAATLMDAAVALVTDGVPVTDVLDTAAAVLA